MIVTRKVALAFVPIVVPGAHSDVSVLAIQATLLFSFGMVFFRLPWRFPVLNAADACLGTVLVAVISIGGVSLQGSGVPRVASAFLTGAVTVALLVICVLLAWTTWCQIRDPKPFAIFLSHHNGGGACAARFLKLHFMETIKGPIFYDGDCLESLGLLFDFVKQAKYGYIVLTSAACCWPRPWCVGEIVTAHLCGSPMVPLAVCDQRQTQCDWKQTGARRLQQCM